MPQQRRWITRVTGVSGQASVEFSLTNDDAPNSVILDGPMFEVCFQEVAALPGGKRALHLDISTPERALERDRLLSLGASIVEEFHGHTWMRDPEGNDFCITDG